MNEILLIGYFELKATVNEMLHFNGRIESPKAPFS